MTREEIQAKLVALAAEQAGVKPDEVTPATNFITDLEFDSLDLVEYAMEVEDAFPVRVKDQKLDDLQTIADAVDLVARQMNVSPAK